MRVKGQDLCLTISFKGTDGNQDSFLVDKRPEGDLVVKNGPFGRKSMLGE